MAGGLVMESPPTLLKVKLVMLGSATRLVVGRPLVKTVFDELVLAEVKLASEFVKENKGRYANVPMGWFVPIPANSWRFGFETIMKWSLPI